MSTRTESRPSGRSSSGPTRARSTYLSPKHLQRYIDEFCGRQNMDGLGMLARMEAVAAGLVGKRLTYRDMVRSGQ